MSSPPSMFSKVSYQKLQNDLTRRCIEKDNYIKSLESLLRDHGIELPPFQLAVNPAMYEMADNLMKEGSLEELESIVRKNLELLRNLDHSIEFHNLNYSTQIPKKRVVPTVGSLLLSILTFWLPQETEQLDILANATGRILPRKMTLLIGPPGSGKSGKNFSSTYNLRNLYPSICNSIFSSVESVSRPLTAVGQGKVGGRSLLRRG